MSRHVVAGAAGFLPSHMVDRLLAKGDEVVGLDNLVTGKARNIAHLQGNPRFTFVRQDICDPFTIEGPVDYVWSMASPASPPDYMRHPIATLRVGSVGTQNMLDLAVEKGARFFHTSTSEVYGDPEVSPQPEEYWGRVNPIGPRSVYDEAKRYAEALIAAYRRSKGLETRMARIFNTYGPRMALDDGRVVPNFIGQALRGEPLTIYGDGSQTRSFCYVDDEIDGLYRLMMSDYDLPMNVGNPAEITILQFAQAIERVFGRKLDIAYKPLPQDDPKQRRPDITKARGILGWEPKVSLDDGLRRTVDFFRHQVAASS